MRSSKRVLVPYQSEDKIQPYVAALRQVDLNPVPFHVSELAPAAYDALLLTGGTDINPALYGQKPHEKTEEPDDERDLAEWESLADALERDLPVLAICRGIQLLNVQQGGTLIQHIASGRHEVRVADKAAPVHDVEVQPGTRLGEAVLADRIRVNSRHHQAIGRPAETLRICGLDPDDGIVESLDHPGKRYVLAVQWHPEDQMNEPAALRLFESFARAIAG